MGFTEWLYTPFFGQKALTGTPAVLETLSARQFNPYVSLGGSNLDTSRISSVYVEAQNATYGWMYLYQPSVRRVIDYIARNISQLGLKVYERVADDEREHRGDHPAAELLRKPNNWTPGSQFIFEFVVDFLVYDNAYALKFKSPSGNLDTLVRLDPPMVGIIGQTHYTVAGYRIYARDGSWFDVPPEDIIHWRGFEPSDPKRGASKLETLREVLAADLASRKAVTEQFKAGLTASGWIERPLEAPELSPEAFTRVRQSTTNQFASGKREWPLLEEGMTFKAASITPEDAQYLQARDKTIEEVCAQYGLPSVPPQNEEQRKQFYADVLPPYTDSLSGFLDLHILQNEYQDDDLYFEFGREKLMDEIYKTLTSASGRPVLLTDEARAKLDLPPVPTGDELVTPANVIVGDNPKPSIGVNPIQDPNKPPDDGSHRTEDAPIPAGQNGNGRKKAPLVPRRRRAFERRDRWAKEYEEVLKRHFERQRRDHNKKAVTDERWNRELSRDLNEVYFRHFTAEGSQAARRTASIFDASYGQNWLRSKAQGTAADINKTTQQAAEGDGFDEAIGAALALRAGAAAKSMATDVAGFAVKVAEEQSEGSYIVTIDGGDCEVCAPFQGSWPAKDVPGWPAYHANCDCIADISG